MKISNFLVAAGFLVTFSSGAFAQSKDALKAKAAELMALTDNINTTVAAATAGIDAQIQQNPALGPFRDVMIKWSAETLDWKVLGPRMIDLYAETFTEAELSELIVFYKSPVGKKSLVELPKLMSKGAAIGAELAQANTDKLKKMIEERAAEIQRADKKPDPFTR